MQYHFGLLLLSLPFSLFAAGDDDTIGEADEHNFNTAIRCKQKFAVMYVTGIDTGVARDQSLIVSANLKPKGDHLLTYDCLYNGQKLNSSRMKLWCHDHLSRRVKVEGDIAECVMKNGGPLDTGVEQFKPHKYSEPSSTAQETEEGVDDDVTHDEESGVANHADGEIVEGRKETDGGDRHRRTVRCAGLVCSVMLQTTPMEVITEFAAPSDLTCIDHYLGSS